MKLKLSPEDFRVDELAEWVEDPQGEHLVYKIKKRKLTTFEAIRMLAARSDLPLDRLSYVGLKDRQGVTSQYISVAGAPLRGKVGGIHYELVGRTSEPLSGANLRGNEFAIVVRDLSEDDVRDLKATIGAVARHGIPNYFDDQRFGSLAQGQGLPGRLLVKGDPEGALKLLIATPGHRDPLPEKKFKVMVGKLWGDWNQLARRWGNRNGAAIVRFLRKKAGDYAGAWSKMPGKERAIHVFAYQSFVWNDAVARLLRASIPPPLRMEAPSIAGRLVFWKHRADEELPHLPVSVPLIDDATPIADEKVRRAIDDALAAEGVKRTDFKIQGVPGSFFKFEERPLVLKPERLVLARPPVADDRTPGRLMCTVSFRLPPGSYATLVMKRLFPGIDTQDRKPTEGTRPTKHRPRRDDRRYEGKRPEKRFEKRPEGKKFEKRPEGKPPEKRFETKRPAGKHFPKNRPHKKSGPPKKP